MADSSILDLTNEMTVKPASGDMFAIADVSVPSAGETKKISGGTVYTYTLMTDESRTITAGGVTVNDGLKIAFGTDGDLEIHHTDGVSYIKNTVDSGTIKVQATDSASAVVDMIELNPDGPTMNIGSCNIAGADNATHGIDFDGAGNTQVKKELETAGIIRCKNNIDIDTNAMSGDGGATGLTMSGSDATFGGTLSSTGAFRAHSTTRLDGAVDINANVAIGGNRFSYTGGVATGLGFDGSNNAVFRQNLRGLANIRCSSFTVDNGITSSGLTGKTVGLKMSSYTGNLTFTAGILTNYT